MTWRQFLNGVLLLTLLVLVSGTTGDPDLWGHVRFGQDMLAGRTVHVPDIYSFTSDRPWVNHEWLSEVAMAIAFDRMGSAGLNLLRMTIVGGVLLLMWRRLSDVNERLKLPIVAAGTIGVFLRAHPIRPQLFSLLMFALLMTTLSRSDDRRSLRPAVLVPALMAVWVNCHGGWIVGLAVFGGWCLMTAVTASWRDRGALAAVAMMALAATLLNPYGVGMWQFLWSTVGVNRPMISDWQPTYSLPALLWIPWIATAGLVVIAARRSSLRDHAKYFLLAILLGLFAIRVSRLDAFFAIASTFFAARALGAAHSASSSGVEPRRSSRLAWAYAGCAAAALFILIPRVMFVPMAPGMVPDMEVGHFLQARALKGNMLTWFDWGEYALWHFGPDLKVSMDGRRETVYSADVVEAHMRFYQGEPGAWRYVDTLQPDYVWLPRRLSVVDDLRRNGWITLCEGPASILLTRRHGMQPCEPAAPRVTAAFPQL